MSGFRRKASVFTAVDFSQSVKQPTSFIGPVQPEQSEIGLAPEVIAEQKRLAEKYGIKTYDRSGNITYDGSKSTSKKPAPVFNQPISVQQVSVPKVSSKQVQSIIPQAEATSELVSNFRQDQLNVGPREPTIPRTIDEFTQRTQSYQQTGNARLDNLQRQSVIADDRVETLERKLSELEDSMFSEANRLRARLGNSNVNVENEAELLDLSTRYKALYAEKQSLELQLQNADGQKTRIDELLAEAEYDESTKPDESQTLSGVGDFNPMELQNQLSPVYTPPTSPEENAIANGQMGTIVDPNFSLLDLAQDGGKSEFNGGIPTFEALQVLQTDQQPDEIGEINNSLQRMDADSQGMVEEPVIQDPTESALDSMRQNAGDLANFFGNPIPTANAEEYPEEQEEEFQGPQQPVEQEGETFTDRALESAEQGFEQEPQQQGTGGIENLALSDEIKQRIAAQQQQQQIQEAQEDDVPEAPQTPDPTSFFSARGQEILGAFDRYKQGEDVFNLVPTGETRPREEGESFGSAGVAGADQIFKPELKAFQQGPSAGDAEVPDAGFDKFSAEGEIPKADLNQGLDALPFTGDQSTQELYLQAAEKLAEQGYLDGKQGTREWKPEYGYYTDAQGIERKNYKKTDGVDVQGFLAPSSLTPLQIQGVSRDGEPIFDSKGTEIPQRFGGKEGEIISYIYGRQLNDRLENQKQSEYFWKLRRGEVSISDALLNPRTKNTYFSGGVEIAGVPKERKEFIKSFFDERGISLDEQIGSVKISPIKFTKDQIDASRTLEPTDVALTKEIRKSFEQFPGSFPKEYTERIVAGNTIGLESIATDPKVFRKTKDGKPLLADEKPTPSEIQEATFRKTLLDVINSKGGAKTYTVKQDEVDKYVDTLHSNFPDSPEFMLTYTKPDNTVGNLITSRANLELGIKNIATQGLDIEMVSGFDSKGQIIENTETLQKNVKNLNEFLEYQKDLKEKEKEAVKEAIEISGYGSDLNPDIVYDTMKGNKSSNIKLPPSAAGFLLPYTLGFAGLPGFGFANPRASVPAQTTITRDSSGNIIGYSQTDPSVPTPIPVASEIGNLPTQQGIAVAPTFPPTGNVDAATGQTITYDEFGNPNPLKPIEITADFNQDPLGFIGQQVRQFGQGGAYPLTNIGATGIGAVQGAAEGDVLGGISRTVMGETILDRGIDAFGAGYTEESGYKPLDVSDLVSGKDYSPGSDLRDGGKNAPGPLDYIRDIPLTGIAYLGGVVNQATQRTQSEEDDKGFLPAGTIGAVLLPTGPIGQALINKEDNSIFGVKLDDIEYNTRYSDAAPAVDAKFAELGKDIAKNPAFYAGSALSEIATFVAAPLAGSKAVKAAEKGAKTTANVYAAISVAGGGSGSVGVRTPVKATTGFWTGLKTGGLSLQNPLKIMTPAMKAAEANRILLEPAYGATSIGTPIAKAVALRTPQIASEAAKIGGLGIVKLNPQEYATRVVGQLGELVQSGIKPQTKLVEPQVVQEQVEARILSPGGRVENLPVFAVGSDVGGEVQLTSSLSTINTRVTNKLDDIAIKTGTYTPEQLGELKTSVGVGNDYVTKLKADIDARIGSAPATPELLAYKKELDVIPKIYNQLDNLRPVDAESPYSLYFRDPTSLSTSAFRERDLGTSDVFSSVNIPSTSDTFKGSFGETFRPKQIPNETIQKERDALRLLEEEITKKEESLKAYESGELTKINNLEDSLKKLEASEQNAGNVSLINDITTELKALKSGIIVKKDGSIEKKKFFAYKSYTSLKKEVEQLKGKSDKIRTNVAKYDDYKETITTPSFDDTTSLLRGGDVLPSTSIGPRPNIVPFETQPIGVISDIPRYTTDFGALPKGFEQENIVEGVLGSVRQTDAVKRPGAVPIEFEDFLSLRRGAEVRTIDDLDDGMSELYRLSELSNKKIDGVKLGDRVKLLSLLFEGAKTAPNTAERNRIIGTIKDNINTLPRDKFKGAGDSEIFEQVKKVSKDFDVYLAKSPAPDPNDVITQTINQPAFLEGATNISSVDNDLFIDSVGALRRQENVRVRTEFVSGEPITEVTGGAKDAQVLLEFTSDYAGSIKHRKWSIKKSDWQKSMEENNDVMKLVNSGQGKLEVKIISGGSPTGRPFGVVLKKDKFPTHMLESLGLDDGAPDLLDPSFTRYSMLSPEQQIETSIKRKTFNVQLNDDTMKEYGDLIDDLGDNVSVGKNKKLFNTSEQEELDMIDEILLGKTIPGKGGSAKWRGIAFEKNDILKLRNSKNLKKGRQKKGKHTEKGYHLFGQLSDDSMKYLKSTGGFRTVNRFAQLGDKKAEQVFEKLIERRTILNQKRDTAKEIARNEIVKAETLKIESLLVDDIFDGTKIANPQELSNIMQQTNRLNKDFVLFQLSKRNGATVEDLKDEYGTLYSSLGLSTSRQSENTLAPTDKQFKNMLKKLEDQDEIKKDGDKYYVKPGNSLEENSLIQANNLDPSKINKLLTKVNPNVQGPIKNPAFIVENKMKNSLGENFSKLEDFMEANEFYRPDDVSKIRKTIYSVDSSRLSDSPVSTIIRKKSSTMFTKSKSDVTKKGQKYVAKGGGKFPYPENILPEITVYDSAADGFITEILENEVRGRRLKTLDNKQYQTQALQKYYLAKNKVNDIAEQIDLARNSKKTKYSQSIDELDAKLIEANLELQDTALLFKTSRVSDNRGAETFNYDDVYRTVKSINESEAKKARLQKEIDTASTQVTENEKEIKLLQQKAERYDQLSQDGATAHSYFDANGNPIPSPLKLKSQLQNKIKQIQDDGYEVTAIYKPTSNLSKTSENKIIQDTWNNVPAVEKRWQVTRSSDKTAFSKDPKEQAAKIRQYEETLNTSQSQLVDVNPAFVNVDSYKHRLLQLNDGKVAIGENLEEVESLLKVLDIEGFNPKEKPPFFKTINSSKRIQKLENDLETEYGYDVKLGNQGSAGRQLAMDKVDKKYKLRVEKILSDRDELKKQKSTKVPVNNWGEIINSKDGTRFELDKSKIVTREDINDFNTGLQETDELTGKAFSDIDKILEMGVDPLTGKIDIDNVRNTIRAEKIGSSDPFTISGKDFEGKRSTKVGVRDEEQAAKGSEHWMDKALEDNTTIASEKMPLMYAQLKKMQKKLKEADQATSEEIKLTEINLINSDAYSKKTDEIIIKMAGGKAKTEGTKYVATTPIVENELKILFKDSFANEKEYQKALKSRDNMVQAVKDRSESEQRIMNSWTVAEKTYASTDNKLSNTIYQILQLTEKENYYKQNAPKVLKRLMKGGETIEDGKTVKQAADISLTTVDPDDVVRLLNKVETKLPKGELAKVDKVKTQLDKEWKIWLSDETNRYKDKLVENVKSKPRSGFKNAYGKETLYGRTQSKWRTDRNFRQHEKTPENDVKMAANLDSLVTELKTKFDNYKPHPSQVNNKLYDKTKSSITDDLSILDNNRKVLKDTAEKLQEERDNINMIKIKIDRIEKSVEGDDVMSKEMKKWVKLETNENAILRDKFELDESRLMTEKVNAQTLIDNNKNLINKETAAINLKTGKLTNANDISKKSLTKLQTLTTFTVAPGVNPQKLSDNIATLVQWPFTGNGVETMTPDVKKAIDVVTKGNKKNVKREALYATKQDMENVLTDAEKGIGTFGDEPKRGSFEEAILESQSLKQEKGLLTEVEQDTSAFGFMRIIKDKDLPLRTRLSTIIPSTKSSIGRKLRVTKRGVSEPDDVLIGSRKIPANAPNLQKIQNDIINNKGESIKTFDLVKGNIAVNETEEKLIKQTISKPNRLENLVKFWATNDKTPVSIKDTQVVNTNYQNLLQKLNIEKPPEVVNKVVEETGKFTTTDKNFLIKFVKAQDDIDKSTKKLSTKISTKKIEAEKSRLIAEKDDIMSSYTRGILKKDAQITDNDITKMNTLIDAKEKDIAILSEAQKVLGQNLKNPSVLIDEKEFSNFGSYIKDVVKTNNQIVKKKQDLLQVQEAYITAPRGDVLSKTKLQVKAVNTSKRLSQEQKQSAKNYLLMKHEDEKIKLLTIARNDLQTRYNKGITEFDAKDIDEVVFNYAFDNANTLKQKITKIDNKIDALKVNVNKYEGEMYSEAISSLKDKFKFATQYEKDIPPTVGGKGTGGMDITTGETLDQFGRPRKEFTGQQGELGYTLPLKPELESVNPVIYDIISKEPAKRVQKYPELAAKVPDNKFFKTKTGKSNWVDVDVKPDGSDLGIPGKDYQIMTTLEEQAKDVDAINKMRESFRNIYRNEDISESLKQKQKTKTKKSTGVGSYLASGTGIGASAFGSNVAYAEEYGRVIEPPFKSPNPFTIPQPTTTNIPKDKIISEATTPSLGIDYSIGSGIGIKPMGIIDTKIDTNIRIKQSLVPAQRPDLAIAGKLTPLEKQRVITPTKLDSGTKPRLAAPQILTPLLFAPVKPAERPILRPRVPFLPPVPFWLSSTKKKQKKPKKKKGKKKTIVWAVPDVWFGKYDPEEYKVIGKTAKTPKKFQTGNFGFDSEFQ